MPDLMTSSSKEEWRGEFEELRRQLTGDDEHDREFLYNHALKYENDPSQQDLYCSILNLMEEILTEAIEKDKQDKQNGQQIHPQNDESTWYRLNKGYKEKFVLPYELKIDGKTLLFKQKWCSKVEELGSTVWDGSIVLSKFLEKYLKNEIPGKTFVELGAGTGVVGIAIAALGGRVTITDMETCLPILNENVNLNQGNMIGSVSVKELLWEKVENSGIESPMDYVIGADVVYKHVNIDALLNSISYFCSEKTVCFLSWEIHDTNSHNTFLKKAEKFFHLEMISEEEQHPYNKPGLNLLKMRKRV